MNRVVLDAELRAKLNGGNTGVELTDEAGNVVGHYLPHDAMARLVESLFPPLTKEQIAEARREMLEKGGVSTADMLAAIADAKRAWKAGR